jgi:hypothetical protein
MFEGVFFVPEDCENAVGDVQLPEEESHGCQSS